MMAGRLLGHCNTITTERYAHLADRFLLDAAERAAMEILKLSDPRLSRSVREEAIPSSKLDCICDPANSARIGGCLGTCG